MRPNIGDSIIDRGKFTGTIARVIEPVSDISILNCWRIIMFGDKCKCNKPVIIRFREDAWWLL